MSPGKLQRELKKRQPFQSIEQEALLNLARTNDQVQILFERLFRCYDDITPSQYNVLRILRGEGKPMQILEIAQRTITVVPGITGLIDRLERKGLVQRERSTEDRRVIFVRITDKALALLGRIDEPLLQLHREVAAGLGKDELRELIRLLEKLRENCTPKL
jgi:MarR family transcriptional regulator, 2-MHQ and catechol-resistance regulon repressor